MKNTENELKKKILEATRDKHLHLLWALDALIMADEDALADHVKSLMFRNVDNDLAVEVIDAINADDENPWQVDYTINACDACGGKHLFFEVNFVDDSDDDEILDNTLN